ncbi:hypothetical protein BH11PAT1_BH11PAT1_6550 [soil metagenome]
MHTFRLLVLLIFFISVIIIIQSLHIPSEKIKRSILPAETKNTQPSSPTLSGKTTIDQIDSLNDDWHELIYPNSEIETMSIQTIALHSGDAANVVAQWYKEKLTQLSYTSKNFTQTTNNGIRSYSYSVGNKTHSIILTIEKKEEDEDTKITLVKSVK